MEEIEVLATSLLDTHEVLSHIVFKELYHLRWPVEEDYKVIKCRIESPKNFSGTFRPGYLIRISHAKLFTAT